MIFLNKKPFRSVENIQDIPKLGLSRKKVARFAWKAWDAAEAVKVIQEAGRCIEYGSLGWNC